VSKPVDVVHQHDTFDSQKKQWCNRLKQSRRLDLAGLLDFEVVPAAVVFVKRYVAERQRECCRFSRRVDTGLAESFT